MSDPVSRSIIVAGHTALVLACMVTLVLWPPQRGTMLLIPAAHGYASPINAALGSGSAILGRGPVRGSIVVTGERSRILDVAQRQGAHLIAIAASPLICGEPTEEGQQA